MNVATIENKYAADVPTATKEFISGARRNNAGKPF